MKKLVVGQCQMKVSFNKEENLNKAEEMINNLSAAGADIIVLPEMFNCPYSNRYFPEYAEEIENSETLMRLSSTAMEKGVYIFGGSIPEKDNEGHIYNTCFIFNRKGEIIGKHRKVHLFDIDVPGRIRFKESDILTPGDRVTVVDTEFGRIGAAICYDIRFPEFMRIMSLIGANIIIVPGAFNMTTGPAHWETLFKARAVDNQVYMIGTSPAREENGVYTAYGNSIVVDPWGNVINRLDEKEGIILSEIDLDMVDKIRMELPILKNRRLDIYDIKFNQ